MVGWVFGLGLESQAFGPAFFFKLWVGWVFGLLAGFETRWMNQGLGEGFEILSVRMLAWLAGFLDLVWKARPSARLFF